MCVNLLLDKIAVENQSGPPGRQAVGRGPAFSKTQGNTKLLASDLTEQHLYTRTLHNWGKA